MTNEKAKTREDRFFFDLHDFTDEGIERAALEEAPPPPTFNEEELEEAKKEAYSMGRQAGADEVRNSQSQKIAELIELISRDTTQLFEAEAGREKIYELEAVKLSLAVMEKLFPLYVEQHGFDELKNFITQTLQKKEGLSSVTVQVHPDFVKGVEEHISTIQPTTTETQMQFHVKPCEDLKTGDCRLSWTDGGAVRDAHAISGEVATLIKETLAAHGGNVHDREEDASSNAAPEETAPAESKDPDDDESGETT